MEITLESIKKRYNSGDCNQGPRSHKEMGWLIVEIERITAERDELFTKWSKCNRAAEHDTAMCCSEIADNAKYNTRESPGEYENACLDIYDAIVEKFGLSKAG